MACEANCIHDPGHEYNMEGPPRLFDGEYMEGPLRFPLPYGPISVRNVGKGTEVEGRRCSRLLESVADQLCESDRGEADIDPVVGPARGDLIFRKCDLENAGRVEFGGLVGAAGDGLGVDARESQEVPASNCGAHGHGYFSESQAVPTSSYERPGKAVEKRNRQIVKGATITCQNLKRAVAEANAHLMDKPRSMVPQDYMIDVEIHLSTSIRWLMEQIDEQDKTVEHLLNVKQDLENHIEGLNQDKNKLVDQLSEHPKSSFALSAIERRQLELLGINKVSDLINQYRFLLMRMSEMKSDKSRSGLSVSNRKDTVEPGKVVHIPKIVKPQSGSCFSKIGDQHEGESGKVEDEREVRGLGKAKIPEPPLFKGKSRADLERFFRYFEPFAESLSLDNSAKALLVGYYVPSLQHQHDSLMQRKACYSEVKRELLDSLGSDSSVATYSLRASLDKLTKPPDKSYRSVFEKVERKVAEAFGSDKNQREQELKKILLRLTQEDPDTSYCSITLPHTAADYYRLKELVLGMEDANKLRSKKLKRKDSAEQIDGNPGEGHSAVSFIGHKPKRTREFKDSPKRSYASVAAIKIVSASCSSSSTKAIKHCFVCGEVVHVAKDCPQRFVEKNKVDKIIHEYAVGGISLEHADAKDKSEANLQMNAFPLSACNAVGNYTVKAQGVDFPATKKDPSGNDSMMPLVGDDAQHCDIFNCIRVNKIEIVRDNILVSQIKPYVKQKQPLSTVVTNDSSIRQKPHQSGKEFRSFCNSSADQFQSTVTSILHQHQLNSQLKDISLNKVLQLESSKSDVLLKNEKQSRPIYDLIL